ncbi:MAG: methylated-DNA--[protein]-cysteine S-methyltransferase [Clostridiales bacterium]|nr:methylated-DNA--[protein]-cysteine S-methyltransferase [Clostridiales bacterium]
MKYFQRYKSPVGILTLISNGEKLTGLRSERGKSRPDLSEAIEAGLPVFDSTALWLDIYFKGEEPDFTLPLGLEGSPFRLSVWKILREIPYGKTTTYGYIADRLAEERGIKKMSARAVGAAVGANPIGIIIPCHRVIGKTGSLTGFGGGIDTKIFLLKTEKAYSDNFYIPNRLK